MIRDRSEGGTSKGGRRRAWSSDPKGAAAASAPEFHGNRTTWAMARALVLDGKRLSEHVNPALCTNSDLYPIVLCVCEMDCQRGVLGFERICGGCQVGSGLRNSLARLKSQSDRAFSCESARLTSHSVLMVQRLIQHVPDTQAPSSNYARRVRPSACSILVEIHRTGWVYRAPRCTHCEHSECLDRFRWKTAGVLWNKRARSGRGATRFHW